MPESSQRQHNIKQLEADAIAEAILDLLLSINEMEELLNDEESSFNKKHDDLDTLDMFNSNSGSNSDSNSVSDDAFSLLTYGNEVAEKH